MNTNCIFIILLEGTIVVVQSLSLTRLFVTPVDCSTAIFPILHHLPEFAQTHVHWVGDAIQSSHPLLPPSSPALNFSQYQGLSQWVSSLETGAAGLYLSRQRRKPQWWVLDRSTSYPLGKDRRLCLWHQSREARGGDRPVGTGGGSLQTASKFTRIQKRGGYLKL